jgi:hypothetical protein
MEPVQMDPKLLKPVWASNFQQFFFFNKKQIGPMYKFYLPEIQVLQNEQGMA